MSIYSTNQASHLYVVHAATNGSTLTAGTNEIIVGGADTLVFLNGENKPIRSDIIKAENVLSATKTAASAMARTLKKHTIVLDSSVNSGVPVKAQDYIVTLAYKEFISQSSESSYLEIANVVVTSAMTDSTYGASRFYAEMAKALAANTANQGMVEIHLATTTSDTADTDGGVVSKDGKISGSAIDPDTNTYTGIWVVEKEQDWILGIKPETSVNVEVKCGTITDDGEDVVWGVVTSGASSTTIGNGKMIADLEYFCLGERGDQYRNMGWPKVITTKGRVDATKTYDVYNIHYFYEGSNEAVQKSEKDLIIVVDSTLSSTVKGYIETKIESVVGNLF